jgi:hypothetical protein
MKKQEMSDVSNSELETVDGGMAWFLAIGAFAGAAFAVYCLGNGFADSLTSSQQSASVGEHCN